MTRHRYSVSGIVESTYGGFGSSWHSTEIAYSESEAMDEAQLSFECSSDPMEDTMLTITSVVDLGEYE